MWVQSPKPEYQSAFYQNTEIGKITALLNLSCFKLIQCSGFVPWTQPEQLEKQVAVVCQGKEHSRQGLHIILCAGVCELVGFFFVGKPPEAASMK